MHSESQIHTARQLYSTQMGYTTGLRLKNFNRCIVDSSDSVLIVTLLLVVTCSVSLSNHNDDQQKKAYTVETAATAVALCFGLVTSSA